MSDTTQFVFQMVAIAAVVTLTTLANGTARPWVSKYPAKKIAWGLLAIAGGYMFLSVPFVGSYYDFSSKLEFPQEISRETTEGLYIREHHHRIERLESELKETKDELVALREHYKTITYLGWYALLLYASTLIFSRKRDETGGDVVKLNLNE